MLRILRMTATAIYKIMRGLVMAIPAFLIKPQAGRRPDCKTYPLITSDSGKATKNVVPLPCSLSTVIIPP